MATQETHDAYLEGKLRVMLETLVEDLLASKPDDVAGFSADWLAKKHGDQDSDQELVLRLRAERDALVQRREELSRELSSQSAAAGGSDGGGVGTAAAAADAGAPEATVVPTPSDDAEQAKIQKMKGGERRAGVSASAISQDRMKDWKKPFFEKPQDAREKIKSVIATNDKLNVLFGHLAEAAVYDVIDAMAPSEVAVGSDLITQGEEGDNFYIVDTGAFDIFVKRGDAPPNKVMECGPGAMFGELALMYNAPRAATVKATAASKVWALDRESFQMMLATAENTKISQYEDFLSNCELFKYMTKYELGQLSDLLDSELFDEGEDIIKQGDEGTAFYILEDGSAKAFISGDKGEVEVKHYTEAGSFFGEVALLTKEKRRATVRAVNDGCSVLRVTVEDFDKVIGPIRQSLEKNIGLYPNYADIIKKS